MWFGRKKPEDKTLLLIHVENGSTATGLVRLSAEQPKLFAAHRIAIPLPVSVKGETLLTEVEHALEKALQHTSEVAARLRGHETVARMGAPEAIVVLLSAPWGRPNLAKGEPDFLDQMQQSVVRSAAARFGVLPISFYTAAGVAAFGTKALITEEPCLVCTVTGEVSELMHLDESGVRAHATFPTGFHGLLRTLRTHAGLSREEARSAANLPFATPGLKEPFAAAAAEFATHFSEAALALVRPGEIERVVLIAEEPIGEWFARALESQELSELFPNGGVVRAVRPSHAAAHISAHAERPDVPLMLATLFVDNHFNRI